MRLTMLLKVFLLTLVLYSVGAKRLNCEELLEPLENQTQASGQWFWVAGASTLRRTRKELRKHNWIEIKGTDDDKKRAVHRHFRGENNTCAHVWGCNNVDVDKVSFRFRTERYRSSHKGEYLKTFDDQATVFVGRSKYSKPGKIVRGISIVLMAKTDHVSNETLKLFKRQVVCAGLRRRHISCSQPDDFCYEDLPEDEDKKVCRGKKEEDDDEESDEDEDVDEDEDGLDEEEEDDYDDESEEEEEEESEEEKGPPKNKKKKKKNRS